MEQVPIRELNQHTASVLARVERGETVEVTNRGKPIARIVPVTRSSSVLDDLIAAGKIIPATIKGPIPMPPGPVDHTNSASNALIAMREEERW